MKQGVYPRLNVNPTNAERFVYQNVAFVDITYRFVEIKIFQIPTTVMGSPTHKSCRVMRQGAHAPVARWANTLSEDTLHVPMSAQATIRPNAPSFPSHVDKHPLNT